MTEAEIQELIAAETARRAGVDLNALEPPDFFPYFQPPATPELILTLPSDAYDSVGRETQTALIRLNHLQQNLKSLTALPFTISGCPHNSVASAIICTHILNGERGHENCYGSSNNNPHGSYFTANIGILICDSPHTTTQLKLTCQECAIKISRGLQ